MNMQTTYTVMRYFEYSFDSLRYEKSCLVSQGKHNKNEFKPDFYDILFGFDTVRKYIETREFCNPFLPDRSTIF